MGEEEKPRRKITIVNVTDVPALEPARMGKLDTLVTYQINTEFTYTIRLKKEEYEELAPKEQEEFILSRVRKDAEWRLRWLGRTVEL